MPEFMFVIKSLVIATVITMALQVRVGPTTLENQAHHWMQSSSASLFLQDVSSGAVMAIRNAAKKATDFVGSTFSHDSSVTRAGRLNFEFKRSPRYEKERQEQNQ